MWWWSLVIYLGWDGRWRKGSVSARLHSSLPQTFNLELWRLCITTTAVINTQKKKLTHIDLCGGETQKGVVFNKQKRFISTVCNTNTNWFCVNEETLRFTKHVQWHLLVWMHHHVQLWKKLRDHGKISSSTRYSI